MGEAEEKGAREALALRHQELRDLQVLALQEAPGQDEKQVGSLVERALSDCPERLVLNNLILPGIHEERRTAEIDVLAISRKGIFVIETKSWNGIVRGSAEESPWTVLYQADVPVRSISRSCRTKGT